MKPLVLTSGWPWPFTKGGFADLGLYSGNFRFIWGPPPSLDEIAAHLGPRTRSLNDASAGMHRSDWVGRWKHSENRNHCDLGVADFCHLYEAVELWFDVRHEAQLELVWLLDYFRDHPNA